MPPEAGVVFERVPGRAAHLRASTPSAFSQSQQTASPRIVAPCYRTKIMLTRSTTPAQRWRSHQRTANAWYMCARAFAQSRSDRRIAEVSPSSSCSLTRSIASACEAEGGARKHISRSGLVSGSRSLPLAPVLRRARKSRTSASLSGPLARGRLRKSPPDPTTTMSPSSTSCAAEGLTGLRTPDDRSAAPPYCAAKPRTDHG